MAAVEGRARGANREHYVVELTSGAHSWIADEPPSVGGTDAGPGPFSLVAGGLAACTAITLRMYAERKSWPLERVRVEVTVLKDEGDGGEGERIDRVLAIEGDLDDGQRARLADIAEKTPVTKLLKRAAPITTTLA